MCLSLIAEFLDDFFAVASDFSFGDYEHLDTAEMRLYIEQSVEFLKIVHLSTKMLEGDAVSTIALVVPTILNALACIEDPQVCFSSYIYYMLYSLQLHSINWVTYRLL